MTIPRVPLAAVGAEVSALGFGCASLGSRVSAKAGLAALERAWEAGVTWYDVAPAYGDGQAEALLGAFARGRRESMQIVTKVGLAPPALGLRQRIAKPAMRLALAAWPSLRAQMRRRRPRNVYLALTPALIADSLEASLRRLSTDHVDVLALHAVSPEQAADPAIAEALGRIVASGKARTAAIAASPEAAAAAVAASPVYGLVQLANNPADPGLDRFRAAAPGSPAAVVTHSVYGHDGAIAALAAQLAGDPARLAAAHAAGYEGAPARIAADLLADHALGANRDGVVIVSMFKPAHLAAATARVAIRSPERAARARALLAGATAD